MDRWVGTSAPRRLAGGGPSLVGLMILRVPARVDPLPGSVLTFYEGVNDYPYGLISIS